MGRYHYVLAFFDFGASPCLMMDSFSASHSVLLFMDTSWETSTSSGVVIAYIKWSYGIFYFYCSNCDHDFFNYVYGTQVFSEQICSQVIIQKTAFGIRFGYYEFLIVFSEPPTPDSLYRFGGPWAPLASPSEGYVLVTREPNRCGLRCTLVLSI